MNLYRVPAKEVIKRLHSTNSGLGQEDAKHRLEQYGYNSLPEGKTSSLIEVIFRQFLSPLIYVLVFASILSWYLGHTTDALFIFAVLILNAIIGTIQEYQAEKSAEALRQLTAPMAYVLRDGENTEVPSKELVPGDIVLLETDHKVPADIRLVNGDELEIDESILTGESQSVVKDADKVLADKTPVADQKNMAFSGTLVTRGRGRGVVVATAKDTQLGKIASHIAKTIDTKTPLMIRSEDFTKKLTFYLGLVILALSALFYFQGQSWHNTMLLAVALAVDAIPEGLPVALTVALAVASRIMAKKNVVVRKLSAVEALGSCTTIATDKTGTLTINEQTIKAIALPGETSPILVRGAGLDPSGEVLSSGSDLEQVLALAKTAILCSDAALIQKEGQWQGHGDSMDVAFLVLGHKLKILETDLLGEYQALAKIPYSSSNAFAADLHRYKDQEFISIKGALEKIIVLCELSEAEKQQIHRQEEELAEQGYRILAVAKKVRPLQNRNKLDNDDLESLNFLGLVAFQDPLRTETKKAVAQCKTAGISVVMVTGDHPTTALSIARELDLASEPSQVVTGQEITQRGEQALDENARVYARVSPEHKLQIVEYFKNKNHFVSVTGDGANDAPALKAAHVGIAMGKRGSDVAKETADLIITDDRFATIVDGIFHGRVAYSNVRKVIYLLLATGAAEIVLFSLAVFTGLPMPLTAVQILWINLVTNGIQDVALAFEPPEGDELERKPRSPSQPLVDKVLLKKILTSAVVMGGFTFLAYYYSLQALGSHALAQNTALLMMVLFGNVMIGNCRSETKSAFTINPLSNPILLVSTLAAQGIHIWAMQSSWFGPIIGASAVTIGFWLQCLFLASSVLVVIEIQKYWERSHSMD